MKILVTGHKGYIGAHLSRILKEAGHWVKGVDIGAFTQEVWDPLTPVDIELQRDFRFLEPNDLEGIDCVMHLAGISNDPMGDLNPEITKRINLEGTVKLAKTAKKAGVPRFLFASSCSIYGKAEKAGLEETDSLNPVSIYAHSKIEGEKQLSELADDDFCPVYLRNATAYGYSPALRIDLVVNNLLGCAVARGDIRIHSDGTPWRPLIHCEDIARAFFAIAEAPRDTVFNQAVNVGSNTENHQISGVAEVIKSLVPKANIVFTGETGADPRNYKVKFDKLERVLPTFRLKYTLASGAEDLLKHFYRKGFSKADFEGDQFIRLKVLTKKLKVLFPEFYN